MTQYSSQFLRMLDERGYIHQITDATALDTLVRDAELKRRPIVAYIGFDATAPSLHVGSLVQIMMLRRLQQCGHKPIIVLGGGTSKIGDPSGKDSARQLLSAVAIANNIASIRKIFAQFLDVGASASGAMFVDNAEWLDRLSYIELLRRVGPHFTLNRMLTFDSVRLRLEREQPLTFLEFNYMILQAYDFLELARRDIVYGRGVQLQMGGSDQWGNIVNGIELARRMHGLHLYGLTTPLLETASGAKMGKTADGAVWLNEEHLSAYDYWQYWRNVDDRDVGRFLRLFTDIDMGEIARLEALQGEEINEAKKVLADAATAMCRGADAAASARQTAQETFEGGGHGGQGSDLPTAEISEKGLSITEALRALGFVASNKEARRKIAEGAVRLNGEVISNVHLNIYVIEADCEDLSLSVSMGKKHHGRLVYSPTIVDTEN